MPTTLAVALTAALILAVLMAPSAQARTASCAGKRATVVSNAKTIIGTKGHDVIQAGGAANRIDGQGGNDTICAGPGDDIVTGDRGSDDIYGEGGNDTLDGYRGKDMIDGGSEDDVINGDRGSDFLNGDDGKDRVFGDSGNDEVTGGPGDADYVNEGHGDGRVSGGPGSFDVVVGDTGNDHVDGGGGSADIASYATSTGSIRVNLGSGSVSGAEDEQLIGIEDAMGGSGNDEITGSAALNRLDGGPGDDTLHAVGSGDKAYGGAGSNRCSPSFEIQNSCGRASGQDGTAVSLVQSIDGSGSLVITGNNGPDRINLDHRGGEFVVNRIGGNPVLLGNTDSSSCERRGGSDQVSCRGTVDIVLVSLGSGDDEFAIGDLPGGVRATIDGGPGSDTLGGGPANDTISSGDDSSPDQLYGGGGDDALFGVNTEHPRQSSGAARMIGGAGNDLMIGGQPCDGDLFDGGEGANDSASFARVRNGGAVTVAATIGGSVSDPDVGSCNSGQISSSTEKIEGSTGPDRLTGDNGSNTLLGRGGDDALDGQGGSDSCVGGGGNDSARGCEESSSTD